MCIKLVRETVIPAKAGIQPSGEYAVSLVPGVRRDDGICVEMAISEHS
ncbi:MAG: hypothetical protein FWG73_03665 [Planctomycetaceae bacterium]|nr:hypothetical protein [Planctomycetaceae bacterium]